MKKILILGSRGMAGHVLATYFSEKGTYDVYTTSRESENNDKHFALDIFNTEKLKEVLQIVSPDFVVLCIGLLIKDSEENPDKAIFLNSYIPHYLDKLSQTMNFKFIHISTNCVFTGKKGRYTETDLPDETNFYGRTRALGEVINNRTLTIRTSMVGPEIKQNGSGLFNWFMNQKNEVNGYSKVIWAGVTTLECAKFICYVIEKKSDLSGLIHLVNNDVINKKDLLELFKKYFYPKIKINDFTDYANDKSMLDTMEKTDYEIPSYEVMIQEMKDWMGSRACYIRYKRD